jgi:hypothetical protein
MVGREKNTRIDYFLLHVEVCKKQFCCDALLVRNSRPIDEDIGLICESRKFNACIDRCNVKAKYTHRERE